jgi:hypothetical protein
LRISKAEIQRLKHEGIPDLPPPPLKEDLASSDAPLNPRRHPRLLAAPSPDAIGAADRSVILENQVRSLHLAREKEETLDWFRERERNAAAARREVRRRSAEIEAMRERKEWLDKWLDFALKSVPGDAPAEVQLDVQQAVEEALGRLDPEQPQQVVQRLVLAAVDKALRPWLRRKEIEQAVQGARQQIPWRARAVALAEPSAWECRAMQAARHAIAKLGPDASLPEMRAAATQAAKDIAREYEHRESCRRLADSVFLPTGTLADDRAAQQAVKDALDKLPVGASQTELEKARDAVLAPLRASSQAAAQADQCLAHVSTYIEQLAAEDQGGELGLGDFSVRYQLAQELKQQLRPILIEKLKQRLLNQRQAHEFIEEFIEGELDRM